MGSAEYLQPVTDEEDAQIRAEYETVVVASGSSNVDGALHLPAPDHADPTPLCRARTFLSGGGPLGDESTEYVSKAAAVYPPGYRDVCQYCGRLWREGEV